MSPVVARFGHGAMSDLSPLSGEERKSNFGAARSVNDPKRTLGLISVLPTLPLAGRFDDAIV